MAEVLPATVKGREIPIRQLNETQMMLFVREANILGSTRHDQRRKLGAIGAMMDILESVVVDADDKEWLLSLAGNGELELKDLMEIAVPKVTAETPAKPVRRATRTRR